MKASWLLLGLLRQAETAYGYLELVDKPLSGPNKVKRFVEKLNLIQLDRCLSQMLIYGMLVYFF